VVKAWVLGAAVFLTPAMAVAQQTSRVSEEETIRARQKISLIEGMFERAVQNGVDNFSRQIQAVLPNADGMAILMGAPQVRGFQNPPIGVFFDVQMPSLQLSMVWPLRYQGADPAALATLSELRSQIEQVSDPQTRQQLTQKLRQVEAQLAPPSATRRRGPQTQVANVQGGQAAVQSSPVEMAIVDDPAEVWRREVRSTLIDAMIENTGLPIGPDEYIVVAARGVLSTDRLVRDAGEARTVELRLKGSDLDAYRNKTIDLTEARKRVQVREY
jgi:hypothetical protein